MKNKKGFTLVEILAVISILAVLGFVIVPIVSKQLNEAKDKLYNNQVENIKEASKMWLLDHKDVTRTGCNYHMITMGDLIDGGYISKNLENPKTKKPFERNYKILFTGFFNDGGYFEEALIKYHVGIEDESKYEDLMICKG